MRDLLPTSGIDVASFGVEDPTERPAPDDPSSTGPPGRIVGTDPIWDGAASVRDWIDPSGLILLPRSPLRMGMVRGREDGGAVHRLGRVFGA